MNQTQKRLFDKWYPHYPLKKARGAAEKAFEKLNPDEELVDEMIRAIQEQKKWRDQAVKAGEFVPPWKQPATWLNQQCWTDEIEIPFSQLKDKQRNHIACIECGLEAVAMHKRGWFCAKHWLDEGTDWKLEETRKMAVRIGLKKGMGREECLPILKEAISRIRQKNVNYGN